MAETDVDSIPEPAPIGLLEDNGQAGSVEDGDSLELQTYLVVELHVDHLALIGARDVVVEEDQDSSFR